MSEYKPITQGLREAMNLDGWATNGTYCVKLSADMDEFNGLCDDIDALHKSLEQECEKLHEKVLNQRKQLADVQEAIERRNNGVLKRRWQKKMDALKNENEEMRDFNYRVREAIRRHEDLTLWGADYTALPLDADGVPIHIGDVMDTSTFGTVEVEGFIHSAIAFYNYNEDQQARLCTSPAKLCHHHKPTVMDVLDELLMNWPDCEGPEDELALKQRCAERLRLADGDADE